MSCPGQPGYQRLVSEEEDAVQRPGLGTVNGNVGLPLDQRQSRGVNQGHPA